jgi:hypothetical protein
MGGLSDGALVGRTLRTRNAFWSGQRWAFIEQDLEVLCDDSTTENDHTENDGDRSKEEERVGISPFTEFTGKIKRIW